MTNQNRQPKGVKTGGQFATSSQLEQPAVPIVLVNSSSEPDSDDYQLAADDCLRLAGLGLLYLTSYDAVHWHARI